MIAKRTDKHLVFHQWWLVTVALITLVPLAMGAPKPRQQPAANNSQQPWAVIHTNMGNMVVELYESKVPNTVAHFIGLASGTKAWRDPKTKKMVQRPFYNGLAVHKIVPTYWVQMGCPLGNGKGGPGMTIKDEFHPTLQHRGAGIVSMASAGPDRNGSQFIITLRTAPWLDAKHRKGRFCSNFSYPIKCLTNAHCAGYARMFPKGANGKALCQEQTLTQGYSIFGKVVHGLRVLTTIGDQAVDVNGRPNQATTIQQITIHRGRAWQRSWLRAAQTTTPSPAQP